MFQLLVYMIIGIASSMLLQTSCLLLVALVLLFLVCQINIKLDSSSGSRPADTRPRQPLPPGWMGWPFFGETHRLYNSKDPILFFTRKQQRYGPIFKSHILGCPSVMLSSAEAARFVLVTHAHLFRPAFPVSKERLLGPQAIFFQQSGDYHARLRRLVLRAVTPDVLRASLPGIQLIALQALRSWEAHPVVNTFQEMKTYAMNVAVLSIFGMDEMMMCYIEELKQCYYTLEKGYNSMPINLPGTSFHKAIKARARLAQIVADIISSRRRRRRRQLMNSDSNDHDLLWSFMEDKEALSDDQITDNVIGVLFAARDTTASVLTWVVKHLAEFPTVLQAVREEQEEIMKRKEMMRCRDGNYKALQEAAASELLTWDDTRRMPLTWKVIQETMRVASILSFTFREAVEDVHYQGYLIPKGWKVLPLFRNIHHSPDNFPEPEKFDPSRFEIAPKPYTFMPFGSGSHSCPGNELAKLEMLLLLHHLTTKYRWCVAEPTESGIQLGPFVLPLNGLPITLSRRFTCVS